MSNPNPSRRTIILGAAASAVAMPAAAVLLLPEAVVATAAVAGEPASRGPAHDWLDAFVASRNYGLDQVR